MRDDKMDELTSLNVLIVDDEPVNAILMKRFLKELGVVPDIATNAHDAMEFVKKRGEYLVLMDYMLPGTSGIELAHELLAISPNLKIAVHSAMENNLITESIDKGLFIGYVTKPFKRDKFHKEITRLFNRIKSLMR
ncbi:response regulator [Halosquirtibacter laminarini]|uniref:Response regulator n=1 Tax=Halosquirtibacter laminarini TaxID=3374600 RepID=A0AC61NEY2_9BACT|nr:response regulator [Prolixibacteraceae bacterium]